MDASIYERIQKNPRFQELVRTRGRFAVRLSIAMLVIYYGFIAVIAFAPRVLGIPVAAGTVTTIGIPIGVLVIVAAFVLTAVYVRRANGEFDAKTRRIIEECR
jgi:uncharacterized membrane protein (DUF485 family)